jgi:hypothetical protein
VGLLDSNKELDQPVTGGVSPLTITRIETIPLRAKLGADFRGSHYHMTHRSTLITRVYTSEGIVGEAYAGDEDATLGEINAIVHNELAPAIVGLDAMATERCWQAGYPVTFDAKASSPWLASTPPSGTQWVRRSDSRSGVSGVGFAAAFR